MCPGVFAAQRNRTIAVGDTVRDSLSRRDTRLPAESTYAHSGGSQDEPAKRSRIDLAATAFDAYAFLVGPGFETGAPQDDDSGGHCNARLTVRLPRTGDYFIVVTSSDGSRPVRSRSASSPDAKPRSLAPCDR